MAEKLTAPQAEQTPLDLHCTPEQAHLWLQGLLAIAWADGNYDDEERAVIEELIHSGHEAEAGSWIEEASVDLQPITPADLGKLLDPIHAENFLRTAVMTALADGIYSESEDQLLHEFCQALGLDIPELSLLRTTLVPASSLGSIPNAAGIAPSEDLPHPHPDALNPIRDWMDRIEVKNPQVARFLCRMIPPQCPFERDVVLFGHKVMHIPAMCKLNPLYEQVVGLRFRALSYLADECGEDVTTYVQG
jgi:tellurite resistance protein